MTANKFARGTVPPLSKDKGIPSYRLFLLDSIQAFRGRCVPGQDPIKLLLTTLVNDVEELSLATWVAALAVSRINELVHESSINSGDHAKT